MTIYVVASAILFQICCFQTGMRIAKAKNVPSFTSLGGSMSLFRACQRLPCPQLALYKDYKTEHIDNIFAANLGKIITVGVAIFQLIIPRVSVPISIIQPTNQATKLEINAFTALILRAQDEAPADIFYIFGKYHVVFKITAANRICGSALLG